MATSKSRPKKDKTIVDEEDELEENVPGAGNPEISKKKTPKKAKPKSSENAKKEERKEKPKKQLIQSASSKEESSEEGMPEKKLPKKGGAKKEQPQKEKPKKQHAKKEPSDDEQSEEELPDEEDERLRDKLHLLSLIQPVFLHLFDVQGWVSFHKLQGKSLESIQVAIETLEEVQREFGEISEIKKSLELLESASDNLGEFKNSKSPGNFPANPSGGSTRVIGDAYSNVETAFAYLNRLFRNELTEAFRMV